MTDMAKLACRCGGYGYRRIAARLREMGWEVNDERVGLPWWRERLKLPVRPPKRSAHVS